MFRWKNNQEAIEKAKAYATRRDFQKIFTEEMAGLHLLAFLLTADTDKAEQCFVAGLESSIEGNPVFRQWARSWSRRAIVKNAINLMAPAPGRPGPRPQTDGVWSRHPQAHALIAAILRLALFERFVLVMTVLENFSIQECAVLLGRSTEEATMAKSHALKSLGSECAASNAESKQAGRCAAFLASTELA